MHVHYATSRRLVALLGHARAAQSNTTADRSGGVVDPCGAVALGANRDDPIRASRSVSPRLLMQFA
jgi:hypothetical protein